MLGTVPIPLFDGLALVVVLFALGKGYFQFGEPFFPVHGGRYQGVALALDCAYQTSDFARMQQQFTGARGVGLHMA